MDAETAAELYDDGTDGGAMMAAEACGMEFSDFVTRGMPRALKGLDDRVGPPTPSRSRRG